MSSGRDGRAAAVGVVARLTPALLIASEERGSTRVPRNAQRCARDGRPAVFREPAFDRRPLVGTLRMTTGSDITGA